MARENDKLISLRMPSETYDLVKETAEALDRPVTWVIRRALDEYLQREKAKEDAYRAGP